MNETSDIKKRLGKRIQELRKSSNFTQEELAELVEIGTSNISYFEIGKFYPSPETLAKLAKALNVEIYELFMFEHVKSVELLRQELIDVISKNNDIVIPMYKFFKSIM